MRVGCIEYYILNFFISLLPSCLFASQGGGDDSNGQRYSADPTGLLAERGAKADKDQDGYMTAMRDKNSSGYFDSFENYPFVHTVSRCLVMEGNRTGFLYIMLIC